jgi:transposase
LICVSLHRLEHKAPGDAVEELLDVEIDNPVLLPTAFSAFLHRVQFVLHTGIQWEYLPQELVLGSGMTCWRRLAAWNEAGVWNQLHAVLLKELRSKNKLDWSQAVIDSSHVRATRRGPKAVPARSTARGWAASTTSSSTAKASRSGCR